MANGLAVPNGPVITPDGKTLIVAESMGRRLTAFDIQADGSLTNRRGFLRVKEGGEVTHKIETGKRMAIACTLGGADGRTFYGLTYEGAFKDISRGLPNSRIETVRVDVGASGSP